MLQRARKEAEEVHEELYSTPKQNTPDLSNVTEMKVNDSLRRSSLEHPID